jgi:hypothetical protein
VRDVTVRRLNALTVASAPQFCAVCNGGVEVASWQAGAWPEFDDTGWPCPHCAYGIPIAHLSMRIDHPRGAA